jgi:Ca2+-binding RTX toxin-like protein
MTGELAVRRGSAAEDHIMGTPTADLLFAGGGDDTAAGRAGDDHLVGGAGDDLLKGGTGDDRISGLAGSDTLQGGAGDDVLFASRDDSTLLGGAGGDTFIVADAARLGRTVIRDFDPLAAGERIHLGSDWLTAIGDLTGDGRVNRHDLLLAFSERDGDLILRHGADTLLVLKDVTASGLAIADFLIL